jgi:hypothetical protein
MSGMPPHTNPLDIAQKSWDMGKQSRDDKAFKWMALAMMGLAGLGATLHAVHLFWKDTLDSRREGQREKERGDRRPPASTSPPADADTYEEASSGGSKKWSQRPEFAERQPQGDHAQAAHSRSHAVRQH